MPLGRADVATPPQPGAAVQAPRGAARFPAPAQTRPLPGKPPEPLAQPVVEARPRELRKHPMRPAELDVDVLSGRELASRAAVDVDLDGLLAGGVVDRQQVVRRD